MLLVTTGENDMIYYDHLPLDQDILKALGELSINYVFQPIFQADGETVYAWEALMRPTDTTVTDLIEKYTKMDKLHVLEVATLFGAMQAYILRGYSERVSINSFPFGDFAEIAVDCRWVKVEHLGNPLNTVA